MSKQVDERIVSMQFDNKRFESNVHTSMSTLDKLKAKLNLSGASKGLENVQSTAKKIDMSGLSSGVETVRTKFSAMEVMAVTALANITNSAVNAGKKIVSALTIDPIKTGFQEYETQINAVQTILANTESKGTTIDDVNAALEELNAYADKTIYNFTEMTRNIGTFTAAGVDLETSTNAIQGIANLAAVSGSNSQQASTAMYQLSQALAAGTVKLMDWNSVVNAGMGGQVFQDALKETARVHGIAIDDMIEKSGSFRETLKDGWLTSEVLTETLQKFTLTTEGLTEEQIEANREMLRAKGYTEEQIEEIFKLGRTATDAATKVKTFTQLWDVLKEAAQSGWSKTWKLIIGDFEEAKAILTPLANFLTDVINKMSDWRNAILESALTKNFKALAEKVNGVLKPLNSTTESVKGMVKELKDYSTIVDEIIAGKWGNAPTRWQDLTEAGYDWAHAQNLVNERLGDSTRHATNYTEAQKEQTKSTEKLTEADAKQLEKLAKLSDEQLRAKGYTEKQIEALRELQKLADKLGLSISDLLKNIDKIDGKWLLLESFKNAGKGLIKIFNVMKQAWQEIFPPKTTEERAEQLFDLIAAFHRLSTKFILNKKNAEKLKNTFKGLFALLDITLTLVGGPIKLVFKIFSQLLKACGWTILDITSAIGGAISKFRNWLKSTLDFTKVFEKIAPYIKKAVAAVKDWVEATKPLEKIGKFFAIIGIAIADMVDKIRESEVARDIISGLANGLKKGVSTIANVIFIIGKTILDTICKVLGIASPSKKMAEVGKWTIEGFLQGLKNGAATVWDFIKHIGLKCVEILKNIDFGAILTVALGAGMMVATNNVSKALLTFSSMFEGLGDFLEDVGIGLKRLFTGIGKWFKAGALKKRAQAILLFAAAIAVLAAAVYVLSKVDSDRLWWSVLAIGALAGIIAVLAFAISKLNIGTTMQLGKVSIVLVSLSLSILLLATSLSILSKIDESAMTRSAIAIAGLGAMIVGLIAASKLAGPSIGMLGKTIFKIAAAILLLAITARLIGSLDTVALIKGTAFIVVFSGIIAGLMMLTRLAGKDVGRLGKTIFKISAAILLLVITARLIGSMDTAALVKGTIGIILYAGIIAGLILITRMAGPQIAKIGSTILAVSAAMMLMGLTAAIMGRLSVDVLAKGITVVGIFAVMIAGLIGTIGIYGREVKRIGSTILMVSIAIAILAGISVLLGLVKVEHLAKGIIAVGLLSGMMVLLIQAMRGANDCAKNLMVLAVVIALMAGAIVGLSFIDPEKVAVATGAMAVLMGMFAVMMVATKSLGDFKSMAGPLAIMIGAIVALTFIVWTLSQIESTSALSNVIALSVLMVALSGVMILLSKISISITSALKGAIALTLMAIPLLAFVGVLYLMQNVQNATTNVLALITMVAAVAVLMYLLIPLGALWIPTLIGIGLLTLMAVPMLAFVGVLALMQNIQNATTNVMLLIQLMTAMTAVLVILAPIAPLAVVAVTALTMLSGLMVTMGVLAVGIGALMEKFPALQSFLNTGIPVLIQLAGGIGEMIGAFVGGIASQIAAQLPSIGENLSLFMSNCAGFIEGAKSVDKSVALGSGILIATILGLTAASFIEGLTSLMPFVGSFADLGTQLSQFMTNAMPFITGASAIQPEVMNGVKTLCEAILILTGANLLEGLTRFFGGESSLATFGSQLGALGTNLNQFVTNLGTFTDAQVTTVDCAGRAIKALANAASEIPNEGGWLGKILGENSLASFGTQLPELATNLSSFVTNLGTFSKAQVTTVDCAGKAIKALAEAASEIPNEGGWAAAICGDNSLATFGTSLPQLGTNIAGFITNLGTFGEDHITTVDCAGKAIKALASAAKDIPNEGGFWAGLCGDNSLAAFGDQLPGLGKNLNGFIKNLGSFGEEQITTVNAAVKAIKVIANMSKNYDSMADKKDFSTFGKGMVKLAKKIKEFVDELSDTSVDSVESAVKKVKKVLDLAKTVASTNIESCKTFGKSLKDIAKKGVEGFVKAFTSDDHVKKIKKAAKDMLDAFIKAAKDKQDEINDAFESIATKAAGKIATKENKAKFKQAGKDLGAGLVKGIEAKYDDAYDAGYKLGQKAVQGEKDGQQSNSPSKLTTKAGKWLGEGLIIGMEKMATAVYRSGHDLGQTATGTISNAVSMIADSINSDMDAQPTIRPVLDLSSVRNGIGTMNGMFSSRTISVDAAGVGAISASMNNRQNGNDNSDIVSGIKALRKDLANMPRESININGVTYDDGSNINDAVKAIVRAAKIERRT